MREVIQAVGLCKSFRVPVQGKAESLFARLKHFILNPSEEIVAVDDVSFHVERGEILGFLGANGSGKSTTIKMLTGILTPTSGEVSVLGFTPYRQRKACTRRIGVVFGQKSLLWWNIPVIESFKLYRDIYAQPRRTFERRLRHFAALLEMDDYLHVPVRKLSLGLRMRAEIIASLLHQPEIIFLDEPTIGLDVLARRNLKRFLRKVNQEEGTTIFLTSHNMFDVEDLCRRCLILSEGKKIYDGDIATLKAAERYKSLELEVLEVSDRQRFDRVLARCEILEGDDASYVLRVPSDEVLEVIRELLASGRLSNLNVVPPSLESIVEKLFEEGLPAEDWHVATLRETAL